MKSFSDEHLVFLKKRKKKRRLISFFRLLIVILFLILWQCLASFNLINTFLYSSPFKVCRTIINLLNNGELIKHITITTYEVLLSFTLSFIIGLFIASLLWMNNFLSKVIDPYLTILNSLPKVALGPLIIIWVGASINSIIFMALMISLFTTIINIYQAFVMVNSNYILMLKSFGASKSQIFRKVIIPSNISNLIATMKINISLSLIGVIMGELLVSKKGLGYLIMYGSQVFNLDLVISSIFILGIISYLMYLGIDILEKIIKKKED